MSARGAVVIVVLAVWVLLGPIAMAFSGCPSMAAMCEGPCGAVACATLAPALSSTPALISSLGTAIDDHLPPNVPAGLEHPPKSLLRSA